jgi:MscS family membrane protein
LSILGYPVTSILAGLGIGGLAVALAAQKTVENLFGCLAMGVDQPFRVGDYIVVEGVKGTVEYLGLRSTRIRTLERTIVTIPNGKLADMRIENFAVRDRYRFQTVMPLAHDTEYPRIRQLMGEAQRILEEVEGVVKGDIEVNFKEITKDSIDLEFVATVRAASYPAFRERKHATIFALLDRVTAGGIKLVRPVAVVPIDTAQPAE